LEDLSFGTDTEYEKIKNFDFCCEIKIQKNFKDSVDDLTDVEEFIQTEGYDSTFEEDEN